MRVSRNSIQSYPRLAGKNNPRFFTDRAARNLALIPGSNIEEGEYCAIGGDPLSEDWSTPVWEVEQYIDNNWVLLSIDPNFALTVTNEGLKALANAEKGEYLVKISQVMIKKTPIPQGTSLVNWTRNDFMSPYSDIVLDTGNTQNKTFTIEKNLSHRTNLMNGGIQFTLKLDVDTLGQQMKSESDSTGAVGTLTEYEVGAIGLFIEDASGQKALLAVGSLPSSIKKYSSTPTRIGNAIKFYLNTTLTNMGNVSDLTVIPDSVNSIPEVIDESYLKETWDGVGAPYNLYLVDNLYNSNIPALAVRTGNPVDEEIGWTFFSPTDDAISITNPQLIDESLQNYMVAAWDTTKNKYVPANGGNKQSSDNIKQQLAGIFVNNKILFAGNIRNQSYRYTYSVNINPINDSIGYKAGDVLTYTYTIPDTENTIKFMIYIINVDPSGKVLQVTIKPTNGNYGPVNTGYISPAYIKPSLKDGQGLLLQITSAEASENTYVWDFNPAWIDKPIYVDTGKNIGKLTTTETEMFVGWCTSTNSIKLALDLRNEATDTNFGVTRYATNTEVKAAKTTGASVNLTTSVTPKRLQDNYIQKTKQSGNPGDTPSNAITVDTYIKYNTPIYGKGIDPKALPQMDTRLSDQISFWGISYRALWGDLAEYYRADRLYPAGTLITIGNGSAEITQATSECNGIISDKPGYELGTKESNLDLPVALIGKVPVLFAEDCLPKFGDRIYLSKTTPGKASTIPYGKCLGKIIDKRENLDRVNSILCSVRITF